MKNWTKGDKVTYIGNGKGKDNDPGLLPGTPGEVVNATSTRYVVVQFDGNYRPKTVDIDAIR